MLVALLLIFLLASASASASPRAADDSRYECGEHGRFEYCVDDIPGCVIGCHCHPGFYFDTDSKICEPNTKLTQYYNRRINYVPEPTRETILTSTSPEITEPTLTTNNPIDEKIDEITQDADDLGDWLYNQFFKTIENQVINKTSGDEQLTRRSGRQSIRTVPDRRSRKSWRKSKKKKKKRMKGHLKKKLLRITEDDSLFDDSSSSDSSSDDTEDSSNSSSDDTSDSDTDTSRDTSKDHGHKKLFILSKKPKPPLPSFIFLPNIDTPFYPPIGLPPPPAVPMYPIVPVPPIGPFVLSIQEKEDKKHAISTTASCRETVSSGSEKSTTAATVTTVPPETTTEIASDTTPETAPETNPENPTQLRQKGRANKMKNKVKNGPRHKLIQKLRQKMKHQNKQPPVNDFMDYPEQNSPFVNLGFPKEYSNFPDQNSSNVIDEEIPREGVDFKYLAQLIHKPNLNKNKKNIAPARNPMIDIPLNSFSGHNKNNIDIQLPPFSENHNKMYLPGQLDSVPNTRRQFRTLNNPEDTFYSNLGRQIATMIRNMDSGGQRQINIEIEKPDQQPSNFPLFFENSYSPRSYWERSVRSPMKIYKNELEHLKKSNEQLFSLENKVEDEASKQFLSLQDIENIISTMQKERSKLGILKHRNILQPAKKSLNFNLLQQAHHNKYLTIKNTTNTTSIRNQSRDNIKTKELLFRRIKKNNNIAYNKYPERVAVTKLSIHFANISAPRQLKNIQNSHEVKYKKPYTTLTDKLRSVNKWAPLKPIRGYPLNPKVGRFNFPKYLANNSQYRYEKGPYPFMEPIVHRTYNFLGKAVTPSYFHHDLHHFDYFD